MDAVEEEVKDNGKDKKRTLDLDWTVPNPTPDIRDRANYRYEDILWEALMYMMEGLKKNSTK